MIDVHIQPPPEKERPYNIQISNEGTLANVHYTRSLKYKKEKLCRETSLDQQKICQAKEPLCLMWLAYKSSVRSFHSAQTETDSNLAPSTAKEFTDINNHG